MKVAIRGTAYVGLVTGACFSELGVNVTCIDIDEEKIRRLQKGEIPKFTSQLSPNQAMPASIIIQVNLR